MGFYCIVSLEGLVLTNSLGETGNPRLIRAAMIRISELSRASENNCVANQWSKPVVTANLLVIFREHRLIATGDNYGEGFTPFTITCAGHPNTKDESAKANRLNLVETGSTGVSYADTVAFKKVDHRLPTDNHQCAEKLQGHSVVVNLYLDVDHQFSIAYRQHLVDLVPFTISGLRHVYQTEGNALLLVCLRILIGGLGYKINSSKHWFILLSKES